MLMGDDMYYFIKPPTVHLSGCACSVCWAHNHCDAITLFPCPALDSRPPFPPNYFSYYDCTAEFKREQRTSARVERASS